MKNRKYTSNVALPLVLGVFQLFCLLVRTFNPMAVLPNLDVPMVVLLSLVALLADHYLAKGAKRCYICIPLFSAAAFGILPFVSGFVTGMEALKLAVVGGAVFTATTWLFTSAQDRISSGPQAKAAPLGLAMGLYLAAQCFAGMIL